MKLNIIFHQTLLAAISAAPRAHARALSSYLRDPRTVKEKEEVHRQTMGDYVLRSVLDKDVGGGITCQNLLEEKQVQFQIDKVISADEVTSLACLAVSKEYPVCQGCQGYSQVGREVHIPGCVGMTPEKCKDFAKVIVQEKPDWFKDRGSTTLVAEQLEFVPVGEMSYYKLGLPVAAGDDAPEGSKAVVGVARNCMVQYQWDWCVESTQGGTMCIKLQPWDCSEAGEGPPCLSSSECCAKIQDGGYPKPDINGNELQCYEWVLPVKPLPTAVPPVPNTSTSATSSVSSGGLTGDRLVIHVSEGKVALPAVITDGNYKVENHEDIIETQQGCPKSFPDLATLKSAVSLYVSQDCANKSDCDIGKEWGHPINTWCVEEVTDFTYLLYDLASFNEDVNGWTTSQVTNMFGVFYGASAFNQPLDNWDVSQVNDMSYMFYSAKAFNQPLNNWDVSSVTTMGNMFIRASAFNQPLNNWDVSKVTTMNRMFGGASAFNQPLNNWDVSSVTNMYGMFISAKAFNQPLDNWDVSKVTNMVTMFNSASAFSQDLCHFGDHFKSNTHYRSWDSGSMFAGSGCPNKGNPTSTDGPWCKASCP